MSPYDLLMPTHAMLARAATRPPEALDCGSPLPLSPSRPLRPLREESPLRKYIVFTFGDRFDQAAQEYVVIFDREVRHQSMLPEHARALSAGFFIVAAPGKVVIPSVGSDSLSLEPRPEDKTLIEQFLSVPSQS